jgi:hypothetical protein
MTDQIDGYLDGAPDHGTLTPEERANAEKLRQAITATRAFITAPGEPDLTGRVMQQIAHDGLRPAAPTTWDTLRSAAAAVWTAREVSFRFRPAYGLVAAAALVLLFVFVPSRVPSAIDPQAAVASEPQLFVQFRLTAPDASDVRIAGSFTGWEPRHQLHQAAPGLWTVTLPLPRGVHDYAFIVDGTEWVADPYAQQVNDGFGGVNSRIALLPPDTPQI